MRVGENPTKFLRHNPALGKLDAKVPLPLTITTVTYVPELVGYYEHGLDIIKLSLASLRETTKVPFDLMVFDNGSCPEIIDFLLELKDKDFIQWLCLSSKNMKKLGAWNHLFSAVKGDFVYYCDSDIFHYPGWIDESLKIMEIFPHVGLVSAYPIPSHNYYRESVLNQIKGDPGMTMERGFYIPEDTIKDLGVSLGAHPESFLRKKLTKEQIRLNKKGVMAYVSAWHAQFLMRGEILKQMFPRPRNWAIENTDKSFDMMIEDLGYLRVSTSKPYVYHMGNVLDERWREEARKYNIVLKELTDYTKKGSPLRGIFKFPPFRNILLRLYAFLYRIVYSK